MPMATSACHHSWAGRWSSRLVFQRPIPSGIGNSPRQTPAADAEACCRKAVERGGRDAEREAHEVGRRYARCRGDYRGRHATDHSTNAAAVACDDRELPAPDRPAQAHRHRHRQYRTRQAHEREECQRDARARPGRCRPGKPVHREGGRAAPPVRTNG